MPNRVVAKPLSPDQDTLDLTSQRGTDTHRRQFHLVVSRGMPVRLSNGLYNLLLELARARIETHSGYYPLRPKEDPDALRLGIHRLRRQIDSCTHRGAGIELIKTGVGCEYRLSVPPGNIRVDDGFSELPLALVATDLRDFLAKHCPAVKVECLLGN